VFIEQDNKAQSGTAQNIQVVLLLQGGRAMLYIYIYIYYEIVHKVHNKKKMKKRQGKNKNI